MRRVMSAIGTKRTSACAPHDSAFDLKRTWPIKTQGTLIASHDDRDRDGVSNGECFQDQSGGSTATISAAAPQTGIRYGYSIW
jgi:hypothetical protein